MNLSKKIVSLLEANKQNFGSASLALCGGRSPIKVYKQLSSIKFDWSNIFITLTDERILPVNSRKRNEYLIRNTLLNKNINETAKFVPLTPKIKIELSAYEPFTVVLLAVAPDGHFASIFPTMLMDNKFISTKYQPDILNTMPIGDPFCSRTTMNLSMLLNSKQIFLLAMDDERRKIIEEAKKDNSFPIHYLINQQKTPIQIIEDY